MNTRFFLGGLMLLLVVVANALVRGASTMAPSLLAVDIWVMLAVVTLVVVAIRRPVAGRLP